MNEETNMFEIENGAHDVLVAMRITERLSEDARVEGIVRICESFAWLPHLKDVYARICESITELLGGVEAHMHLISLDGNRFVKCAAYTKEEGKAGHYRFWRESVSVSIGRSQWMKETRLPIVMDLDHPNLEDVMPVAVLNEKQIRNIISIPLLVEDVLLGMISVSFRERLEWCEDDIVFLTQIGRTVGSFVKRANDTKKAEELQVLNERKMLSTEIHENVSALIGALSINASAAIAAFDEGDEHHARIDLERLESTSREVMRMLRDEMFSLRVSLDGTDDLIEGISEMLVNYSENWGIETKLSVKGSYSAPLILPRHAALQLTRILNECLSNSLRHANASFVRVEINSKEEAVSMIVVDNGCGFDVDKVGSNHFGLKIMRERAIAAGGRIEITSNKLGTSVNVEIPRRKRL